MDKKGCIWSLLIVTSLLLLALLTFTMIRKVDAHPIEGALRGDYIPIEVVPTPDSNKEILESIGITIAAENLPAGDLLCNVGSIWNEGYQANSYFTSTECLTTAMAQFPPAPGEIQYCRLAELPGGGTAAIFFNGAPGFISKANPPFEECTNHN